MITRYTVRRPISESHRGEGIIVSRHRSLAGAIRSLERQTKGARKQGGYSQDYVRDEATGTVVARDPLTHREEA
jgi:hypothetical protein